MFYHPASYFERKLTVASLRSSRCSLARTKGNDYERKTFGVYRRLLHQAQRRKLSFRNGSQMLSSETRNGRQNSISLYRTRVEKQPERGILFLGIRLTRYCVVCGASLKASRDSSCIQLLSSRRSKPTREAAPSPRSRRRPESFVHTQRGDQSYSVFASAR